MRDKEKKRDGTRKKEKRREEKRYALQIQMHCDDTF